MHCAAADADGNIASYTSTVGESCGVIAPGTGVLLNNFLGEDDIQPAGAPLPPGSRMLTSICPMILDSRRGRCAAVGSSGSSRIRSAIVQVVSHLIDEGVGPNAAVRRPRVHWESGTLYVEGYGRVEREIRELCALTERSEVTRKLGFFFGGAQAVEVQGGAFGAGADNERRGGTALVL
jgi:gamma-glutamyltranspeptidase/glutathione hydrolase